MQAALQPLLTSPTNGAFLSTCVQHCHQVSVGLLWDCGGEEVIATPPPHTTPRRTHRPASQNISPCYDDSLVEGQSVQDSFLSWYRGGSLKRIVVDGVYGTNPTCYCSPY